MKWVFSGLSTEHIGAKLPTIDNSPQIALRVNVTTRIMYMQDIRETPDDVATVSHGTLVRMWSSQSLLDRLWMTIVSTDRMQFCSSGALDELL